MFLVLVGNGGLVLMGCIFYLCLIFGKLDEVLGKYLLI